jgi:hypothetical protein
VKRTSDCMCESTDFSTYSLAQLLLDYIALAQLTIIWKILEQTEIYGSSWARQRKWTISVLMGSYWYVIGTRLEGM